jgi:hypothetical protein
MKDNKIPSSISTVQHSASTEEGYHCPRSQLAVTLLSIKYEFPSAITIQPENHDMEVPVVVNRAGDLSSKARSRAASWR